MKPRKKYEYSPKIGKKLKSIALKIMMGMTVLGQFVPSGASASELTPEPRPAQRDTMKPHAGVLLGMANPNGKPSTAFNYGADIGIQPYIPFGVGLQFNRFDSGDSEDVNGHELTRMSVLAKATYNFGGDICIIQSSYLGLKTGAVFDEYRNKDRTHFGIGPVVGFDHPIVEHLTLGLELSYLAVVGPESPDSTSLNGAIKYWF